MPTSGAGMAAEGEVKVVEGLKWWFMAMVPFGMAVMRCLRERVVKVKIVAVGVVVVVKQRCGWWLLCDGC